MIGRRLLLKGAAAMTGDGLARPLNAPPGAELTPGIQPGSPPVFNRVFIVGPKGGLFVYSPTIGKNNLVETAGVTVQTTDKFGNVILPGDTLYMNQGGTYYAHQIAGGPGALPLERYLVSSTDQTGTYSTLFIVGLVQSAGLRGIDLGSAAAFANPPQCFSNPLFAQDPTTPANGRETSHLTPLSGSWANVTGEELRHKLMSDGTVIVHGQLTIPTGVTGPSNTIGTVGGAYFPARDEPIYAVETAAATPFTGTAHLCAVRSANGHVDIFGAATSGNTLSIQGRYPLTV